MFLIGHAREFGSIHRQQLQFKVPFRSFPPNCPSSLTLPPLPPCGFGTFLHTSPTTRLHTGRDESMTFTTFGLSVMLQFLASRLLRKPPAPVEVKTPKRKLKTAISKPLVWIDCEMTGLDISKDHIIEICCMITDGNLNLIDSAGYESTVYVPKKVLDNMNEWCVNQHGKSGLTARILANPNQTLAKVQDELLAYIQSYIPEPRTSLLAGNSVHMDKFFMMKEFPKVIDHLHYRLVDVSSIMEVGFRHNPALMKLFPKKKGNHTAKSDILESINQLRWYRDHYLRSDVPEGLKIPADRVPPEEPAAKKQRIEKGDTTNDLATSGGVENVKDLNAMPPSVTDVSALKDQKEVSSGESPKVTAKTVAETITVGDDGITVVEKFKITESN